MRAPAPRHPWDHSHAGCQKLSIMHTEIRAVRDDSRTPFAAPAHLSGGARNAIPCYDGHVLPGAASRRGTGTPVCPKMLKSAPFAARPLVLACKRLAPHLAASLPAAGSSFRCQECDLPPDAAKLAMAIRPCRAKFHPSSSRDGFMDATVSSTRSLTKLIIRTNVCLLWKSIRSCALAASCCGILIVRWDPAWRLDCER